MRFLTLLCLVFFPATANALSCAAPILTEEGLAQYDVIFVGERIDDDEGHAVPPSPPQDPKNLEHNAQYTLVVDKAWKGAKAGDRITITRNTYWGDHFDENTPYVVFAIRDGSTITVPLCSPTSSLEYAKETVQILQKLFP